MPLLQRIIITFVALTFFLKTNNTLMKKTVIPLLLAVLPLLLHAQMPVDTQLLGQWTGKLNVGSLSLTLVLHLEEQDGSVVATLDSPDQGARGLMAAVDYLSADSLGVSVGMLGAAYRARLRSGKLCGTFTQRGMSLPLTLQRGSAELRRPQRPQQPYPYPTEEVRFFNAAAGATLAGTLAYPVGYEDGQGSKPPVVLLVSGSGLQNRNEEVAAHEPFLVLSDFLARRGIASLRYDDRATGGSTGGDVDSATTADFMLDAAAGIQWLRESGRFASVGCLGHSEGGSIAFMLAARGLADFIITLAAPAVKGDSCLALQVNRMLTMQGLPATMTAAKYRAQPAVQNNPWLRWFVGYDPSADIRAVRCPVMALNGEMDCQVIAEPNLMAIQQLLAGMEQVYVKQYPQLNHLFQHCTTGLPYEYSQIEETMSPEVMNDIAIWIDKITKRLQ